MQKSFQEKRRHPRLQKNLPLTIEDKNRSITTETTNISCLGAYCRIDKYIEPMTKLKIGLILPYKVKEKVVDKLVKCQGVVVRTEKVSGENFNIAIYFNRISNADIKTISSYISQHLSINTESFSL